MLIKITPLKQQPAVSFLKLLQTFWERKTDRELNLWPLIQGGTCWVVWIAGQSYNYAMVRRKVERLVPAEEMPLMIGHSRISLVEILHFLFAFQFYISTLIPTAACLLLWLHSDLVRWQNIVREWSFRKSSRHTLWSNDFHHLIKFYLGKKLPFRIDWQQIKKKMNLKSKTRSCKPIKGESSDRAISEDWWKGSKSSLNIRFRFFGFKTIECFLECLNLPKNECIEWMPENSSCWSSNASDQRSTIIWILAKRESFSLKTQNKHKHKQ